MGSRSSKSTIPSLNEIHENLHCNIRNNNDFTVTLILSNWFRTNAMIPGIIQIIEKYVGDEVGQVLKYGDSIKIVVVGTGGVGKTTLLRTYVRGYFEEDGYYYIFDPLNVYKQIGSYQVEIGLYDTAGQEEWDRLRPLYYPQTDVFILCFSISDKQSREDIATKWIPEVRKGVHLTNFRWNIDIPIILCGTKIDLRDRYENEEEYRGDIGSDIVENRTFGDELSARIGAVEYVECSSVHNDGVNHVFERAVIAAIMHKEQKKLEKKSGFRRKSKRKKTKT